MQRAWRDRAAGVHNSVNACTCNTPILYGIDGEARCSCGHEARDDLGGDDVRARVAYRAKVNRLRGDTPKPAIDPAQHEAEKSQLAELIKLRRAIDFAPRVCDWCGETYQPGAANQKRCGERCTREARRAAYRDKRHAYYLNRKVRLAA